MAERTIPLRLSDFADLLEAQQAPHNLVLHMRAAADEIERLRARLEIDPSHPYDGIYARDETIRGLEKEISSLLNTLADARTESMKLRARVTELEGQHKGLVLNNAILRERPDLPLNRIPAARAMTKLYEDNERLRAALRECLGWHDYSEDMHKPIEVRAAYMRARAALEGK